MVEGGSNLTAGVREGDVLAGKYRIERVLGIGGMGVVVAAHHLQLDERVAIKFLLSEMLANAEAMARFSREARAAVKIKSEHVARVFDVGTLETGAPYMVMEYLDGGDLGAWLQQRGPLPIEQAVDFVIQACVAVAEAHGLGIVHRDLKPSILFCVRGADGRFAIKVLDFGISKVTTFNASGPGSTTKTSAVIGSPLYMSPEQMQSAKDVDARTDIWALGIVLYELLTGRVPFSGETMAEIIVKIATHTPEPLRAFRPDIGDGLDVVFRRCTEKDRDQRYRNVAELGLALLPFAPRSSKAAVEKIAGIVQSSGLSATALSVPPSPGAAESQAATQAGLGSTARPTVGGRGPTLAALVGTGTLVLAVAVGWRITSQRQGSREGTANGSSTTTVLTVATSGAAAHEVAPVILPPERLAPKPTEPGISSEAASPTASSSASSGSLQKNGAASHGPTPAPSREAAPSGQPSRPAPPSRLATTTPAADPLQALRPHQ